MTSEPHDITNLVPWSKKLTLKNGDASKNIVFIKIKFISLNSIFNYGFRTHNP